MNRPTLRFGARGDAVRELQQALAGAGYQPGPADGSFGALTYTAVRAFQRDRGLVQDGVVGPATWTDLLGSTTATATDAPRGVSVHIGVNRINPTHYGTDGVLHGCENDARDMERLARGRGFRTSLLLTEAATSAAVLGAIRSAAASLRSGDLFLLTYAGHGTGIPDPNTNEEEDGQDEAWCLFDRMLVDDELFAAWSGFAPGVRVFFLSDSCHSGTMTRSIINQTHYGRLAVAQPAPGADGDRGDGLGAVADLVRSLPMPRPLASQAQRSVADATGLEGGGVLIRQLPYGVAYQAFKTYEPLYGAIKRSLPRSQPAATVIAVSGCQDNQSSQELNGHGLFTQTLLRVWAGGRYSGDHRRMHRDIVAQMPPDQTPNYTVVGAANADFEQETPFTIRPVRAAANAGWPAVAAA